MIDLRGCRSRCAVAVVLVAGCLAGTATAQDPAAVSAARPAGTRRALVVCGLPGDDDHRAKYAGAVEKIVDALVHKGGFAASAVWVRFGVEPRPDDGPALKAARGLSTRDALAGDVEAIRKAWSPGDALWVIVLGHAHFDGRRAHLNLPGPDLSDAAFAKLFDGLAAGEQVFFVTTSASGFFLKPLSRPGRVGISATEADQEVNETLFPLALADMLAAPPAEADRDKDGALSVFELYLATIADVMRRYAEEELIATEHAQLDDNGDGHGSEVQLRFLPPESGGQPEEAKPKEKAKKEAAEAKKDEAKPPTLGPKDDGYLSSKIRVDVPPATKAAAAPPGGPR